MPAVAAVAASVFPAEARARAAPFASRARVAVAAPLRRARASPARSARDVAVRAAGTIEKVSKDELEKVMKVRALAPERVSTRDPPREASRGAERRRVQPSVMETITLNPAASASRVANRSGQRSARPTLARPLTASPLASLTASPLASPPRSPLSKPAQDRSTPLVIDFFATWCGPCVLLASELEKVKAELGDAVRIVKVDTDEEADLSTQLQIQGLPTLVFVGTDTEKPALRTEGMLPAEMVKSIIANEL
jgi:thioredoxin